MKLLAWKRLRGSLPLVMVWLAVTQQPAFGGAGIWTPLGPAGGGVSLYASPADPQRLWATPFAGAWLTVDGGGHWEQRSLGLDSAAYTVLFVPDPRAADVAYVVDSTNRIYQTFDAGQHWSPALSPPGRIFSMSIDPFESRTLFLGSDRGLFRSLDQGTTWTSADQGLPFKTTGYVFPDPHTRGTLLASVFIPHPGTPPLCGLAKSSDGADHWSLEPTSLCPERLLFSPSLPGVVFAQANSGVWRSGDEGRTWTQLPSRGFSTGPWAIDPAQPSTLYVATGSALLRSTNGGRAWVRVTALPAIDSVAVAADGSAVWASGTQCAATCGPFASTDHGTTWSARQDGLSDAPGFGLWVDRRDPLHVLLGVGGYGVMSTNDGGHSWSGSAGIHAPPSAGGPSSGVFDQAMGSKGYFYAAMGFLSMPGPIDLRYRSFDGGSTWTPWSPAAWPVAFQPASPGRILGLQGATLVYSDDSGDTWVPATGEVNAPQTFVSNSAIAFSPALTTTAYAMGALPGASPGTGQPVMWRSSDAGASWQRAGSAPDAFFILPDPNDVNTIYAVGGHGELWVTFDGGASWTSRGAPAGVGGFYRLTATSPTTIIAVGSRSGGVGLSTDGGVTWNPANEGLSWWGVADVRPDPADPSHLFMANWLAGVEELTLPVATGCATSATTLCLGSGRFKVEVVWKDFQGHEGAGQAVPVTADTGTFWFFASSNVELVLKVLDERSLNNAFWVFYGALSNVQYTITVTDTQTGRVRIYANPPGRLGSFADTAAFPGGAATRQAAAEPTPVDDQVLATLKAASPGGCAAGATTLCLNAGRFQVGVAWKDFQGNTGVGQAVPLTADTGYFWFFSSANVELVLKVLDERSINQAFWVFYGALSNVQYTITVTDTQTGRVRTYTNPLGHLASFADTRAFPGG